MRKLLFPLAVIAVGCGEKAHKEPAKIISQPSICDNCLTPLPPKYELLYSDCKKKYAIRDKEKDLYMLDFGSQGIMFMDREFADTYLGQYDDSCKAKKRLMDDGMHFDFHPLTNPR